MFEEPIFRVYVNNKGYMSPTDFLITPKGGILLFDEVSDSWGYPPEGFLHVTERYVNADETKGRKRKIFEGDLVEITATEPYDILGVFYGEVFLEDGMAKVKDSLTEEVIPLYSEQFLRDIKIIGNTWGSPYDLRKIIEST